MFQVVCFYSFGIALYWWPYKKSPLSIISLYSCFSFNLKESCFFLFFYPPSVGISFCVRTVDMVMCLPHLVQPCCVVLGRAIDLGLVSRLVWGLWKFGSSSQVGTRCRPWRGNSLPMPCMLSTKLYSPTLIRVCTLYLCLVHGLQPRE